MSTPLDVVRRFYDEIWNRGDLARVPALCRADFAFRGSLGDAANDQAGFVAYVRKVRAALEDYTCTIEDAVCEGDRVFARMSFRGRNVEPLLGYAPTARLVSWAGAALFEVRDGQIASLWVVGDLLDLTRQLENHWSGDGCAG